MGMFNSMGNGMQGMPQDFIPRPDIGPNVGIGRPVERPGFDVGFGYGDLPQSPPDQQMAPAQQMPVPGFQPTWQQMGFSSLEAMKDAMDPGWRNSPAQPGFGPAPMPMPQPELPPSPAPIAEQVQQQIANPIYGQSSPFQPPMQMPQPMPEPPQMMPPQMPPTMPYTPRPDLGPDVGFGVPTQPPSMFRPMPDMGRPIGIGRPTEPFTGGLRPAPRNFRPPRGGNLRSRTRMR